ncbi:MAG: RsmB/NOP family class I SAM-dependent RNA methyltransferase [Pseudomonadales bacterium]
MTPLPSQLEAFHERLIELLGAETAAAVLASMARPKRCGYWRNPLRAGPAAEDQPGEPVAGLPGCRSLAAPMRARLVASAEAESGAIYPMNPSSLLAPLLLAPQAGQEVLDLAAAPGGKTLVLAALMRNTGRIAAVDPVPARFHRMRANLERCGVSIAECYGHDGRSVGRKVPGRFDAVLLDAPCSSEARMRLDDPDSYRHWRPRKVRETARKQRGLIRSAFAALKPGGRLLYCTCAFAPEENEAVVDYLLRNEPEAELLDLHADVQALLGGEGRIDATWTPRLMAGIRVWQGQQFAGSLARTLRVLPDSLWDGFYLALLRRGPSVDR